MLLQCMLILIPIPNKTGSPSIPPGLAFYLKQLCSRARSSTSLSERCPKAMRDYPREGGSERYSPGARSSHLLCSTDWAVGCGGRDAAGAWRQPLLSRRLSKEYAAGPVRSSRPALRTRYVSARGHAPVRPRPPRPRLELRLCPRRGRREDAAATSPGGSEPTPASAGNPAAVTAAPLLPRSGPQPSGLGHGSRRPRRRGESGPCAPRPSLSSR